MRRMILQRKIRNRWRRLLYRACERGLLPAQTEYRRFIIIGMGRCGSNLIRTALARHPNVVVFNELFNHAQGDHIGWAQPGFHTRDDDLRLREEAPLEFIERRVFRPMWPGIKAVGFKLFYYHVPEDGTVWRSLERQPDLAVIHLKRRHLLEAYASLTVAEKTGVWVQSANRKAPPGPEQVELEYQSCLKYFNQAVEWREAFDRRFPQALEVHYEDLMHDYARQMQRIQRHLGLRPRLVHPTTRKQNRRPLQQRIANYRELQTRFRGSQWEHLFDR